MIMGKFGEASKRTIIGVTRNYSDDYVYVAPSLFLINKKLDGNGLYANRAIKSGTVIMEYTGKTLTPKMANSKKNYKNYFFDVKDDNSKVLFVIDGANNRYASAAKFVNAADTQNQQNAKYQQYNKKIYLVAIKNIKKNQEILAWYGKDTSLFF